MVWYGRQCEQRKTFGAMFGPLASQYLHSNMRQRLAVSLCAAPMHQPHCRQSSVQQQQSSAEQLRAQSNSLVMAQTAQCMNRGSVEKVGRRKKGREQRSLGGRSLIVAPIVSRQACWPEAGPLRDIYKRPFALHSDQLERTRSAEPALTNMHREVRLLLQGRSGLEACSPTRLLQ